MQEQPKQMPLAETLPPSILEFLRGIEGIATQVQVGLDSARKAIAQVVEPYLATIQKTDCFMTSLAVQATQAARQMAPMLAAMDQMLKRMPVRNTETVRILAQHGWYLDPEGLPGESAGWAADFAAGRIRSTHDRLCRHFMVRLKEAEQSLCRQKPARAKFIRSAFRAHRRRDYAAAIPLLLAQADGFCWDITRQQLYSRRGLPKLRSSLAVEQASAWEVSFLIALIEPTPLSANALERSQSKGSLHRHAIMHGESLDYDTKLNSCRAISLLIYVAWILGMHKQAKSAHSPCDCFGRPACHWTG